MSVIVNSVDTTVRVRVDSVANKVIAKVYQGRQGPTGPAGASGGSTNAWNYNAKTNATSGYPGNGYLLWNNATQTSATSIIISHLTDDDTDIELFLSFFVLNQKIFIQNRDDSSQNQVWQITGTPTVTGANTSTAYYTFPVTLVSSAGAAFTNNHSILFGQIVVATNAVTSATTSDGTADLLVANLSFLNGEFITTLSSNQTDDRTVVMPNADGTLVVGGGTASGTNTGDQDLSGYALTSSLGTGAAFDAAPTANPSTEEMVTTAVAQTLTNKTLTSPAINSATIGTAATFNATSYTYGAGAAAEHRTALGVGTRLSALASNTNVTSSTTLQSVASLSVVAGKSYAVYAQIAITGTANTGTRHGITFPASTFIRMTRKRATSYIPTELTADLNLGIAETTTLAELVGFINVTVSGTVNLLFAQNTSHPDTTTCRTFTFLTLTELT